MLGTQECSAAPLTWDGSTRASSAVLLSRGINSPMGVGAPNAAPINHGTGARAFARSPQASVAQQQGCDGGASLF